jgi:DNA repair protein SbcC/Rad50
MKILKLRFKNLNSLVGEWCIDFTDSEYTSNGIFAITGPTGSGKSTVLDAISLALYGRTPRLDKVTSSTNEIMSRHNGECFSEVTFETVSGCYRCNWSQRRSRNKADGNLQSPKHEFVDDSNDIVLENKLLRVAKLVEDKTGMDFERFTRSILLAQGSFAAFLKASPDDRSPILEQITGTEIYTEISKEVNRRNSLEKGKLNILEAEMNNVQIFSEEEEKLQKDLIHEKDVEQLQVNKEQEHLNEALLWLEKIEKLKADQKLLDEYWQEYLISDKDFIPNLEKLKKAEKALKLSVGYNLLFELRKEQKTAVQKIEDFDESLPVLINEKDIVEKEYNFLENELNIFEIRFESEMKNINDTRGLDSRIKQQTGSFDEQKKETEKLQEEIVASNLQVKESRAKRCDLKNQKDVLKEFFEENCADEKLLSEFSAIEQMFSVLGDKFDAKNDVFRLKNDAVAEIKKTKEALESADKVYKSSTGEFERAKSACDSIDDKLKNELQGGEFSDFRNELDKLRTTEQLYKDIEEVIDGIEKAATEIRKKNDFKEESTVKIKLLKDVISKNKTEIEKFEIKIDGAETQVRLQNRIKDLELQRKLLEDNKECPLCGSLHHPFADGNVPILNDLEKQFKELKKSCKLENENYQKNELELGRLQTLLDENNRALSAYEQTLKEFLNRYSDLIATLQITASYSKLSASLAEKITKLKNDIASFSLKIKKIEEYEERKAKLLSEKIKKEIVCYRKEVEFNQAKQNVEAVEKAAEQFKKSLKTTEMQYLNSRVEIMDKLSKYGEFSISEGNFDAVKVDLKLRRNRWIENVEKEKNLNEQYSALDVIVAKLTSRLFELNKILSDCENKLQKFSSEIDFQKKERAKLFGVKNCDAEEKKLNWKLSQLRSEKEEKLIKFTSVTNKTALRKNQIEELQKSVIERTGKIESSEIGFYEKLSKNGFENENEFINAILSEEEFEKLSEVYQKMINRKTEIRTLIKNNNEQLQKEKKRELTDQPAKILTEELKTVNALLKEIHESLGALKNKLSVNKKHKECLAGKVDDFNRQKKETDKWNRLNELIGSHDGKKFRNFAQGITFDLMVMHANKKLRQMTDRYLLQRDTNEPLELNVIDDYQCGEIRTVKNLSGGESFIVSLALALGLSNMSSHNVRVDSLFLDEGFGTLDEDALETALETLGSLQQEGKLIGVISHIGALKERIPTQIQISPKSGGRSVVFGPGCYKI